MNVQSFVIVSVSAMMLSASPAMASDMSRMPVLRAGRITSIDYPPLALRQGAQGETRAAITIDTDGRISNCRIVKSSGYALLDSHTCTLLVQRFTFDPALDAKGHAVASQVVQPISWIMPDEQPASEGHVEDKMLSGSRF